jgi:hypothetical protein
MRGRVAMIGAASVAVLVAVGEGATTGSAKPPAGHLPAAGSHVALTQKVKDATLQCHGKTYRLSLSGTGGLTFQERVLTASGAQIDTVATDREQLSGKNADFGEVSMQDTGSVFGELVNHSKSEVFPAEESMPIDPVFHVQHDPCMAGVHDLRGTSGDPGPAILRNQGVARAAHYEGLAASLCHDLSP